ncbi:hypothetical protein DYH10_02260 [Candidatus Saccharibacteria bacterium CPR2]|nr:hypothetical protein [Candidatus Saccharibacteria bacterium CPR2]
MDDFDNEDQQEDLKNNDSNNEVKKNEVYHGHDGSSFHHFGSDNHTNNDKQKAKFDTHYGDSDNDGSNKGDDIQNNSHNKDNKFRPSKKFNKFADYKSNTELEKSDNEGSKDKLEDSSKNLNGFYQNDNNIIDDITPRKEKKETYQPPATDPNLASMHQQVNMHLSAFNESSADDEDDSKKDSPEVLPVKEHVRIASSDRFGFFKRPAKLYLLEFIIYIIGLSLTLATIIFMLQSTVLYFGDDKRSGLFGSYEYQISLYFMTLLAVVLPLSVIFSRRTRLKEIEDENVFRNKNRRVVLYLFLLVLTLFAVFGLATFIFDTVDQIIAGGKFKDGDSDPYWVRAANHFIALTFYVVTAIYFVVRRASSRVKSSGVYFTLGLGLVAVAGSILVIIFPFNAQYNTYVDNFIENDIKGISTNIESYALEKSKLPENLDALELSGQVKKRAQTFGYSYKVESQNQYQLCATFKSDTTGEKDSYSNSWLDFGSKYSKNNVDPSRHKSGQECFDYKVESLYPDDLYQYENFDNLFEQYNNSSDAQSSES